MSQLTNKIAREHFFDVTDCGHPDCPEGDYGLDVDFARAMHDHHLIEVTEQAVREQIVREIEDYAHLDILAWGNVDTRFGVKDAFDSSIRIVKGVTDE